jgi:hypothetical protein
MSSCSAFKLLAAALIIGLGGCLQLDPLLYTPERLDHYEFKAEGNTPLTTVDPSRIEQLTLTTEDGVRLGAVYVRAAEPPRAYALFFHGKGAALPRHMRYIKRLANMGYDVLAFDYRGFGISDNVTPTEEGIEKDGRAALAYLVARAGGPERIFYYGHSLGGAIATQRAELDAPMALVLESTFGSIEEFTRDSTQMDFPAGWVAGDSWATSTRIRNVHAAVLLLHGVNDDFVRPEFSMRVYENANEPKRLLLVDGARHGDIAEVMGEAAYASTITEWVDSRLPAP